MIVEAGWDLMVEWAKVHATKAQKANTTSEQKQIALRSDATDMLAEKGA